MVADEGGRESQQRESLEVFWVRPGVADQASIKH